MTVASTDAVATPAPTHPSPWWRGGRSAWIALAALLVVAVVAGVVWSQLAPKLVFLVTVIGPFPASEAMAGKVVDVDAWFAALSIAVGVVAGVAALIVVRPTSRWRAPVGLVLTAAGLFVMFAVGQVIVNSRLVWSWHPVAGDNHQVTGPLVLQAWGVTTIAPIIALVIIAAAAVVADGSRRDG
jgi:hypothetical protein